MDPIRTQRAVDITAERIRNDILRERWAPGELLPPERTLATTLGVNRLTLRAALARLEAEYLVAPRQGQGIRILDWKHNGSIDIMQYIDDRSAHSELLTLRRSLAAEAVRLACIHAEPEQIDVLQRWEERQRHEDNPQKFFDGDLAFTKAMVDASGSLPLKLLFNSMERVFRAQPDNAERMLQDRYAARASYAALVALIKSGEPDLARRAVLQVLLPEDHPKLAQILHP